MASDAEPQREPQLHAPAAPEPAADGAQKPPVKRSFRRKYRKMRLKFDEAMNASNQLIMDEWKAHALARRLREQNDQILDILLDMNDTARLAANLRFDLRELSEADTAHPSLEAESDPEAIQQKLHDLRTDLANGVITPDEYAQKADQLHRAQPVHTTRSLASLEAKVPHTTDIPDPPIEGIDLTVEAPGYMSPAHEEEYLAAMDAALADPSYNPNTHDGRPLRVAPTQPIPTEKDLTVRNPDSVYNWLRKNQPQVFLQDKDPQHQENMSEKGAARTGNAGGGRGKRQSAIAGTPGPRTDHEDDDPPDTGKGKRGKGEEDAAYRPKGGASRLGKRRREDGDGGNKTSRKKNRVSAGTAG